VLYIPVVRSPELTHFHETLWQEISEAGSGILGYYHPDQWVPHITIGFGDMSKDILPSVLCLLSERGFHWEITINTLALICFWLYITILPFMSSTYVLGQACCQSHG
jgi:hypothetical protein